jgi:hypothetical protein
MHPLFGAKSALTAVGSALLVIASGNSASSGSESATDIIFSPGVSQTVSVGGGVTSSPLFSSPGPSGSPNPVYIPPLAAPFYGAPGSPVAAFANPSFGIGLATLAYQGAAWAAGHDSGTNLTWNGAMFVATNMYPAAVTATSGYPAVVAWTGGATSAAFGVSTLGVGLLGPVIISDFDEQIKSLDNAPNPSNPQMRDPQTNQSSDQVTLRVTNEMQKLDDALHINPNDPGGPILSQKAQPAAPGSPRFNIEDADQLRDAPNDTSSTPGSPISADNAHSIGGAGISSNSTDQTGLPVFINDIWGRVADRTDPFANSPFDIWRGGGSGGSSLNAALSQLLAMANADLAAGRACLANPEGCSGTLPYSPGQVQTVANQVLKAAGANAVNARAAAQTVNSPSGATPSSTVSGLSAQRPGSPTAGQRIAAVPTAGSSSGVEPTNSTVHTTVTPQLSSASHGNPNPPSGAAPGGNAGGIGSVATRTGSAASSAAARGASSAASSATSQAASAAAANAASRAASNAASRTASAAAANAASRAASAAAANAASRVRIPTVSDIRLKRDIVEVGELPDGLHLYRYRYLWSDTVYVGVMAQEVLTIAPDAVVRGDDGYLRVDYGRLGLQLTTWDQWTGRGRQRATDRQ